MPGGSRMGAVVALLALSACSLLTSTDGLSGGASPDAGLARDANVADGAGARAGVCAGRHAFCDDFDRGSYDLAWQVDDGAGSLAVNMVTSKSKPFSLLAVVPANKTAMGGTKLSRAFTTDGKPTLTCSFAFLKETAQSESLKVAALEVSQGRGSPALSFGVHVSSVGGELTQYVEPGGPAPTLSASALGFKTGEWHRITVIANADGVAFELDDVRIADIPYARAFTRSYFSFRIGNVLLTKPTGEWRVRFDDVVCDLTP